MNAKEQQKKNIALVTKKLSKTVHLNVNTDTGTK